MQKPLISLIVKLLRDTANKFEDGTCEASYDQQIAIIHAIAHVPLNKVQACKYLHKERSRFDDLVRAGKIPKGKPKVGSHELVWYEDELALLNLND